MRNAEVEVGQVEQRQIRGVEIIRWREKSQWQEATVQRETNVQAPGGEEEQDRLERTRDL